MGRSGGIAGKFIRPGRRNVRIQAWFKRAVAWVTLCVLVLAAILARSASEDSGYTCLRFGLVCRGCYPQLNHARIQPD